MLFYCSPFQTCLCFEFNFPSKKYINLFSIPANELKKRVTINWNTKQEGRETKKVETTRGLDVPSPAEAIIAFGWNWENQILRSGKNKWEECEGRDCGIGFSTVRVNRNIFIIGGYRLMTDSTCTDIYNIDTNTWSEGPKLNIGRLEKSSMQFMLYEIVKPNAFWKRMYRITLGIVKCNTLNVVLSNASNIILIRIQHAHL